MLNQARALQSQLTSWRRDFHQHPELGFQEVRTAGIVAAELRRLGLPVQTGVGKTGVVASIGEGSPVVGIRADMDALPLQETNNVPYASTVPDVMHACGHDAHTSILLGVARLLSQMDDRPPGEIRLFFQPCEETQDEEGKSGAMRMIEEGALDGVDSVIALHVASDYPAGKVYVREGYVMAAVDTFYATIKGHGCHAAYPHYGVDPIYLLAQVVNAIHGVRARRIDPTEPALISIGSVHGGFTTNVIPDEVQIQGTIRSYDEETRHKLWAELERALGVTRALGGDYVLRIEEGFPALHNDAGVAELLREVATDLLGESAVCEAEAGMGAEDFAFMAREAPGAMFNLGAKKDEVNRPHHNPNFDIDESVMPVGVAVLAEAAVRLLRQPGG